MGAAGGGFHAAGGGAQVMPLPEIHGGAGAPFAAPLELPLEPPLPLEMLFFHASKQWPTVHRRLFGKDVASP